MTEPITTSLAAIAVVKFLGYSAGSHLIGGEVHHSYRELLERWQESVIDHPHNHDLEDASENALRSAALVLVLELAGQIEPQKSWLTRWAEKQPGGNILAMDLFPGAKAPHQKWLNALRKTISTDRFTNLHAHLKLNEDNLRQCFAEGDICKALGPSLAEAFLQWSRFELQGQDEHPHFERLIRDGWIVERKCATKANVIQSHGLAEKGVPNTPSDGRHVSLVHLYCLFFREHLKRNAKVFRILIADTLNEMRVGLEKISDNLSEELKTLREQMRTVNVAPPDFSCFEQWLDQNVGDIKRLFSEFQTQFDAIGRSEHELAARQGEMLAAITIVATEVRRGTLDVNAGLESLSQLAGDTEAGVELLLGDAVQKGKTLGEIQAGLELLVEAHTGLAKPASDRSESDVRLASMFRSRKAVWAFGAVIFAAAVLIGILLTMRPHSAASSPPSKPIPARLTGLPAERVLETVYQKAPTSLPIRLPRLRLALELAAKRSGEPTFSLLRDGDVLASRTDRYCAGLQPLTDGFLYVFQVDSSGNVDWLFPHNSIAQHSSGDNPVQAAQQIRLPHIESQDSSFYLDNTTGVEHFYVVFSAVAWNELESVLASAQSESIDRRQAQLSANGKGVQQPNGLEFRGVGGVEVSSNESGLSGLLFGQMATQTTSIQTNSPRVYTASDRFIVIERWFRHR